MPKSLWLSGKQLNLPENKPGPIHSHFCTMAVYNSVLLFSNPFFKLE